MRKHLFSIAAILGAVTAGGILTSCQSDEMAIDGSGKRSVRMSVKISRGDDATRALITESDNELTSVWEEGDRILVTDASGGDLGTLTIESGAGTENGLFSGDLTVSGTGEQNYHFFYLGKDWWKQEVKNPVVKNIASQDGLIESFSYNDFYTSTQSVTVSDKSAWTEDMNLKRRVSFAHFSLSFEEGVEFNGGEVRISGAGVYNTASVDYTNAITYSNEAPGGITVNVPSGKSDFYVTLLPKDGEAMAPTFTVTVGNKKYKCTLPSRTVEPSIYLRDLEGEGIELDMREDDNAGYEDPYPDEDPQNPLHKFAKGNLVYEGNEISVIGSETATGSLYQWGRNVGFADYIDARGTISETEDEYGNHYWNWSFGMNGNDGAHAATGYRNFYNTLRGQIGFCQEAGWLYSSVEDLVDMKDSWVMNARLTNNSDDYWVFDGGGNGDWYSRAKACGYSSTSPCPEGFRLPTAEEWKEILPSASYDKRQNLTTLIGSVKEIRTSGINGVKYAIRWLPETNGVRIECVVVPSSYTSSNIGSVDWNSASVVTRFFPYSGKITSYYERVGNYYYGYDSWATPAPNGTFGQSYQLDYNTGWGLFVMIINNDFSKGVSGYWSEDSNYVFKFSDNAKTTTTANSYFLLESGARHDGYAIRPVMDIPAEKE